MSRAVAALPLALLVSACSPSAPTPSSPPSPVYEYYAYGKLWDAATLAAGPVLFNTGLVPEEADPGFYGSLSAVSFSPDGQRVATGGSDVAGVWDVGTGQRVSRLADIKFRLRPVQAVRFRADGLLVVADAGTVWQPAPAGRPGPGFPHRCRLVAVSPDGSLAAGDHLNPSPGGPRAGPDLDVTPVYNVATGAEVARMDTPTNRHVSFSPDGSKLVTVSYGPAGPFTVRVWDARTGKGLAARPGSDPLAWTPDGKRLAIYGADKSVVEVWDPAADTVAGFRHGQVLLTALAFSPDGTRLALAGPQLRVWDFTVQREVAAARAGPVLIEGMAFSPDGRTLVTVGESREEVSQK